MSSRLISAQVLVEGLDLSGKSSVCHRLCETLTPSPIHRRNIITQENDVFGLATGQRDAGKLSLRDLAYVYLAALQADIDNYTGEDSVVLQESLMGLRLCAYCRARGLNEISERIEGLLSSSKFPVFEKAFLLTASIEERARRLDARMRVNPKDVTADDLLIRTEPKLFLHNESILVGLASKYFNAETLDTSSLSIDDTADYIANSTPAFVKRLHL